MSARPRNPDAEPSPAGDWLTDTNVTPSFARVGDPRGIPNDATYAWTPALSNPVGGCVILGILDDTARTHQYGVVADNGHLGPARSSRVGQKASQTIYDDFILGGTTMACQIADFGPCWPTRCAIQTCNGRKNHHMRTNGGAAYTAVYDDPAGEYVTLTGRPGNETAGPWSYTLAKTIGPQRVPVTDPAHAALLRGGRPDDDAQARTGWFGIELARAGVELMVACKWNNPWDTTKLIPAGVGHWYGQVIDSGSQYSSDWSERVGANAWDSDGQTAPATASHAYNRGSATVTWSSANGGRLLISANTHKFVDPATLDYQQECTLDSASNPALNGTYFVAAAADATHCELTCTSNPGGTLPTTASLYNREEYPVIRMARLAVAFIKAMAAAGKPCFLYLAPHLTHDTGLGADGYGSSYEKCYDGAVALPSGGGLWFDGVEGDVATGCDDPATATEQGVWQANAQMMCSVSDAWRIIHDGAALYYGQNVHSILTSDQGQQNGDQGARGNGGVKTAIWQSSASPFAFARGPLFAEGVTQPRPSSHMDIGLTILDVFAHAGLSGLGDNHMHEDRDGCSWIGHGARPSIFDPSHPAYNRILYVAGDWKAVNGEGYVAAADARKFVRSQGVTTGAKSYDTRLPSGGGDYESAETSLTTGTTPTLAEFNSRFDAIDDARWNQATNTNPAHDGTVVQT